MTGERALLTRVQAPRKIPVTVTMMSETTRWAAPLALTRGLLVGLCVCWPSYTSAEGTQRDPSQAQTPTADAVEAIRLAAEQGVSTSVRVANSVLPVGKLFANSVHRGV